MPLGAIYSILRVSWCQLRFIDIFDFVPLARLWRAFASWERQWQFENDLMGPFIHFRVNLSAPVVWLFITRKSQ